MVTSQEIQTPAFSGSAAAKEIAARAFDVLRGRGMFMSDYAAIRVPLDDLVSFLGSQVKDASADSVSAALEANPAVFAIEVVDEVTYVLTTRLGTAPVPNDAPSTHSFAARFMTPEPKPEKPVRPAPERARVDPNWATYSVPDFGDADEDAWLDEPESEEEVLVVVEPAAEAAPVTEEG